MTLQIKVELEWVHNIGINNKSWLAIATPVTLVPVHGEEACMVTLLYHHKCDQRLIASLQNRTRLLQCCNFIIQDILKLTLRNSIAIEQNPLGFSSTPSYYNRE